MLADRTASAAVSFWPAAHPAARRTLACIGFSGGGTTVFRPWASHIAADTQLALYCYPGRDIRSGEALTHDWDALLADATGAIAGLADRPYTLFGHSLGAWVAFEVAAALERRGLRPPARLVVSAMGSPPRYRELLRRPPTAEDCDEQLLAWLLAAGQVPEEVAAEPELVEMAMAFLRADLTAAAGYRYVSGTVTSAPITVLFGRDDPDLGEAAAAAWLPLTTSGDLRILELPGGHVYTDESWSGLPTLLAGRHPVTTRPAEGTTPCCCSE
jgi:surfactin synthase thioesterase subunit